MLDSETYVGGHVESIEAGVFRSDIPVNFAVDPGAVDELIRDLDAALTFSITVEEKKSMDDIANYDEVKEQIISKLQALRDTPNREQSAAHLSSGCRIHVPEYYDHQSIATRFDDSGVGLRRVRLQPPRENL